MKRAIQDTVKKVFWRTLEEPLEGFIALTISLSLSFPDLPYGRLTPPLLTHIHRAIVPLRPWYTHLTQSRSWDFFPAAPPPSASHLLRQETSVSTPPPQGPSLAFLSLSPSPSLDFLLPPLLFSHHLSPSLKVFLSLYRSQSAQTDDHFLSPPSYFCKTQQSICFPQRTSR